MNVAALIGSPVGHSLSPVIHQAAFDAAGVDWTYAAFDVPAGRADDALAAMRVLGIAGLSVTTPHKEQVAECVDGLAPAAATLHSVNTVVAEDGDRLVGHNTDGHGFLAALHADGVDVCGMHVAVLGAGPAARSVVAALDHAGVAAIVVLNRTPGKVADVVALAPLTAREAGPDVAAQLGAAELIVNATSVGFDSDTLAARPGGVAPRAPRRRPRLPPTGHRPAARRPRRRGAHVRRARDACPSGRAATTAVARPSAGRRASRAARASPLEASNVRDAPAWQSRAGVSVPPMLRFLTAGESHGQALVVILEGLPAGLAVTVEDIQGELARRRLGFGRGPRQRFEADELTLIGGVRHGRTLGSPVAIEIANTEWTRTDKWHAEMSPAPGTTAAPLTQVRPGHADLAGMQKYGFTDARDVLERASARETAARVAAGAVAKLLLRTIGIEIISHVVQMGEACSSGARPTPADRDVVDDSPVRCFDPEGAEAMITAVKAAAKDGDSLGGVVEVLAYGVPVGLGSHVHWDRKLDGLLAQAVMSIQAVKAVELGDGFDVASPARQCRPRRHPLGRGRGRVPARHDTGRRCRGRDVDGRTARHPGGDEAASDVEPADPGDRRHGDEGGDGLVQGAHRRDGGAGDGRGR